MRFMVRFPYVVFFAIFLLATCAGCPAIEPGADGDRAREGIGEAIRRTVPAPWGEIGALLSTSVLSGVAVLRGRKHAKDAKAKGGAAEAAIFGIEEVYQRYKRQAEAGDGNAAVAVATLKQVKQAAKKASVDMLKVPEAFEGIVGEVVRKNGFAKA